MIATAFDKLAANYDTLWTNSVVGRAQRQAVWRYLDPLVRLGDEILDLGCGTGEDAVHLQKLGAKVYAIDASSEMVRIARARGVEAWQLSLDSLSALNGKFDIALSNFGVFNCLPWTSPVARALVPAVPRLFSALALHQNDIAAQSARLIRPGGYLAICLMGRCCAWEVGYFLKRGQFRKAFRRWHPAGAPSGLGISVTYPFIKELARAFRPHFKLTRWTGIGLSVPPSYVKGLSAKCIMRLVRIDQHFSHWPLLRALSDHRLLLFTRL
jgi:SAM-dependent methyltransferase